MKVNLCYRIITDIFHLVGFESMLEFQRAKPKLLLFLCCSGVFGGALKESVFLGNSDITYIATILIKYY